MRGASAWWGLTQASDILKIDKPQRKLQIIKYASHGHLTVESKVHKVEEKLFRKVTIEENHVLRLYLQQNNAITYNLRLRPITSCSRPKMTVCLSHVCSIGSLSERSKHYTFIRQNKLLYVIHPLKTSRKSHF